MRANVTTFVFSLIIATHAAAGITNSRCSSFSTEDQEFIEQLCNANKSLRGGSRHFCSDDFTKILQKTVNSNFYTYQSPNRDGDKVPYIAVTVRCENDGLHFVTLNMYNMGLETIPDSLGQLNYLEELYLSKNKLSELPTSVGELSDLRILDVTENNLISLPIELTECKELILMKISWNPNLNSIPEALTDSASFPFLNIESTTNKSLVKRAPSPGVN